MSASSTLAASQASASAPAVATKSLWHAYGTHQALADLSLEIHAGELFVVLGPNGGGKTTLFRLLSTLIPVQRGSATIFGSDLARDQHTVRQLIGVVFQAPSVDRKLTVVENIRVQASLYGLAGQKLKLQLDQLLDHFQLRDRANERTERLSGGLRRRVELAKGLIHRPRLLLLDEPSTGLDPAARSDLWQLLKQLQVENGTTVVLTTHYLNEAEGADRLAILNEGKLVALGTPEELRAAVGGDSLSMETADPLALAHDIQQQFGLPATVVDQVVRLEVPQGHAWVSRLATAFPGRLASIRLGQPTLEDVFISRTGHRFRRNRQEGGDDQP